MDIIQVISSFSLISIIAFFITIGFLVFEVAQLLKERQKHQKPSIPQFNKNAVAQSPQATQVIKNPVAATHGTTQRPLVILLVLALLLLGGVTVFSVMTAMTPKATVQPEVVIREVQSGGIKVYTTNWEEMDNIKIAELKSGDVIYPAIETIKGSDIDMARIRVNESNWNQNHNTTKFNNQYNVFYTEYTVGSDAAKLKIEAQLHSRKDGWLGE